MSFLTGFSNFAQGAQQGAQNGEMIRQHALQIQQAQMALDQEKKKNAAMAYAGGFLGGGQMPGGPPGQPPMQPPPQQQGPMAQPMPPGQSSAPAQPQGGMQAPPPQVAAGGPAVPSQAPQQPQQQQPPPGPPPPPDQGGGSNGFDPTDPQAPIKVVMQIAKAIKAQKPDIPPDELFMAAQQVIESSKGLAPALRQGAQVVVQQMRDTAAQGRTDTQVAGRKDVADTQVAGRQAVADTHSADVRRGQDMSLQGRMAAIDGAMKRVQAVQGAMDKRYAAGQGTAAEKTAITERVRAITAQLTAAQKQLAVLKNPVTGQLDDADPRVKKAMKDAEEASAKLEIVEKKLAVPQQASGAPAADTPMTATDAKGNKVQYVNGQWVPMGK